MVLPPHVEAMLLLVFRRVSLIVFGRPRVEIGKKFVEQSSSIVVVLLSPRRHVLSPPRLRMIAVTSSSKGARATFFG